MTEMYCVLELPNGRFISIQEIRSHAGRTYKIVESKYFTRCLVFGDVEEHKVKHQFWTICLERKVEVPEFYKVRRVKAELFI